MLRGFVITFVGSIGVSTGIARILQALSVVPKTDLTTLWIGMTITIASVCLWITIVEKPTSPRLDNRSQE